MFIQQVFITVLWKTKSSAQKNEPNVLFNLAIYFISFKIRSLHIACNLIFNNWSRIDQYKHVVGAQYRKPPLKRYYLYCFIEVPIITFIILYSFLFKVDNWADNEALRNPLQSYSQQKPIYRRSLSELPQSNYNTPNPNRRSLGNEVMPMFPKSSTSMTDIQSSKSDGVSTYGSLNRSSTDASNAQSALYTYIGISGPDKEHIYQNQSVADKQNTKYVFNQKQHDEM